MAPSIARRKRALAIMSAGAAAAAIIAWWCCAMIFEPSTGRPSSSSRVPRRRRPGRRLGRRRRLGGLTSYLDPRTVELRPSVVDARPAVARADGVVVDHRPATTISSSIDPASMTRDPSSPDPRGVAVVDTLSSSSSSSIATIIPPYDVDDAILSTRHFRYTYFFFVYDSASDVFHVVHNVPSCDYGCARVHRLAHTLSYALRVNFPSRILRTTDGSNDLVFMIGCGDAPRVYARCLESTDPCDSSAMPPVLQFGSIFRDHFRNMIAMPLPVRPHMPCLDEWQENRREGGAICSDLLPLVVGQHPRPTALTTGPRGGLPFGEELGIIPSHGDDLYWDALVPQIIWRGTDFQYLHTMYPNMRPPTYRLDIEPREAELGGGGFANEYERRRWAIQKLWEMGDDLLLPRWRGVLLTSEAELEAAAAMEMQRDGNGGGNDVLLPWVNIKFANVNVGGVKTPADQNEEYLTLQGLGIAAIGEYVSMAEQAKFKYHIDLGGGGGTTWTGTIEKLAMPGLLFHHVTPTKDWFHDLLVPWEHYVPVAADLSDLRRKYEWAESHPVEARQIAENGTRFARWMGSLEGLSRLYEEFMVTPLRNVILAYRPMPPKDRQGLARVGKSVLDVILESGNGSFKVVSRCTGQKGIHCKPELG